MYDNENNNIKDYEYGVKLKDKVRYILDMGELTQDELGKVLGFKSNEVHYLKDGWIPSKNVISVINKLYRLWYEIVNGEE